MIASAMEHNISDTIFKYIDGQSMTLTGAKKPSIVI
jgi:hypothetical protein